MTVWKAVSVSKRRRRNMRATSKVVYPFTARYYNPFSLHALAMAIVASYQKEKVVQ
jgi:hypothetical protein